jgi:hypothetical protein
MEIEISSDDNIQTVSGVDKVKPKRNPESSDSEGHCKKQENIRKFRKKIYKKPENSKDFFDFNSEFIKIKPKISTEISTEISTQVAQKSLKQADASIELQSQKEEDGTITPPPLVFKQEKEELKQVLKRIKNLEKKSTPKQFTEKKQELEISVKVSDNTQEILQDRVRKNFQNLYAKLKVLKGEDVLLFYKSNRIYPSATVESVIKLFKIENVQEILEFHVSSKNLKSSPLSQKNENQSQEMDGINIKIQDQNGLQLKLSCKETTEIKTILKKWAQEFKKDLKSFKLKSQGEILKENDCLGDADVEDGDVLEIFYV